MDEVEEVKAKTDIVTVIGERIDLKRAGRNYKALCPFHGEKTPSFMVSPEIQVYKCFGCGVSGDVFSFLMDYEGMEFPEALKMLAEKVGITLHPRASGTDGTKEKLFRVNDLAAKFYHYVLTRMPEGEMGRKYLKEVRGISDESIEVFNLGFAPESPRLLTDFLTKKKSFSQADLILSGLSIRSDRGTVYDRFRGRVIFPLYDHRGNTVGLAGRILPEIEKKMTGDYKAGKYINSPETPVYHKGSLLYAMSVSRPEIKRQGFALAVEGELDAISCWQSGIKNVVAIKGSALTEDHCRVISRVCDKLVLALDSDFAGNEAARRGIFIAEKAGLEVRVATLGNYKDPDEAARADVDYLRARITNSFGVWDFLIDTIASHHDLTTGTGKGAASRELVPLLAQIDNSIVADHYIALLASKLGTSVEVVRVEVEKLKKPAERSLAQVVSSSPSQSDTSKGTSLVEGEILRILLKLDPHLLDAQILDLIKDPVYAKIAHKLAEALEADDFTPREFARSLPPELAPKFTSLLLDPVDEESSPDELKKELDGLVNRRKDMSLMDDRVRLTSELVTLESRGDRDEALRVEKKIRSLDETRKKISNKV